MKCHFGKKEKNEKHHQPICNIKVGIQNSRKKISVWNSEFMTNQWYMQGILFP